MVNNYNYSDIYKKPNKLYNTFNLKRDIDSQRKLKLIFDEKISLNSLCLYYTIIKMINKFIDKLKIYNNRLLF